MFYVRLRFAALRETLQEIDQGVAGWMQSRSPEAAPWVKQNPTDYYLVNQKHPTRLRFIVGCEPLPKE